MPHIMKGNWKMSTCNRLDFVTLGCQLIMPRNLPGHWCSQQTKRERRHWLWVKSTTNLWVLGMQTSSVGDRQCKSTSMVGLHIFQWRGIITQDSHACSEYICFLSFWRWAKSCNWGLRMHWLMMVNNLCEYCLLSKVVSIGKLNYKTSKTSYILPRSSWPLRCITSTWAGNSRSTNISWTAMTKGPLSEALKLMNLGMTDHGRPLQAESHEFHLTSLAQSSEIML